MKKIIYLILALLLVASLATACGKADAGKADAGKTPAGTAAVDGFKTIGDLLNNEAVEMRQSSNTEKNFIYAFEMDGVFYRAIAPLSEDVSAQLSDLDILADDYEEKQTALISPLQIAKMENLSDLLPSQEEMDKWVGKTGKDLFDAGWTNSGWNLDDMVFWMDYGIFQYDVVMEGEVGNYEDFDDEDIDPLVVKSVTFNGQLGNATDIEED